MRSARLGNPARDESAAFRLVFVILGATALVVIAAWLAPWFGAVVFFAELGVAGVLIRRASRERAARHERDRLAAPRADVGDTPR